MSYAPADREADPYAGFEARIVPENITLLPKTANQTTGGNTWSERAVTVKKGDTIATILREIGATPDEIKAIAAASRKVSGCAFSFLLSTGRVSSRCA